MHTFWQYAAIGVGGGHRGMFPVHLIIFMNQLPLHIGTTIDDHWPLCYSIWLSLFCNFISRLPPPSRARIISGEWAINLAWATWLLLTEHYLPSVQRGELNTVQRLEVRRAEGHQVIYSLSVIHRVPGFLFSRPNWVPPTSSPARDCCSSLLWNQRGRNTRLRGREWWDPITTKGQALWHSMYSIKFLRSYLTKTLTR